MPTPANKAPIAENTLRVLICDSCRSLLNYRQAAAERVRSLVDYTTREGAIISLRRRYSKTTPFLGISPMQMHKFFFTITLWAASARAADPPASPRQHLSLDAHWQFTKGDPTNAQSPDFDDKSWRALDVPHDWSIEGPYDQANPTGGNGGFLPAGIGWYRRHFTTPASFKNKIATLQFDGIYMNATVYLNGKQIARQPYGYTSFTADLTPNLAPEGQENILAVRVDNSVQPDSRWYTGSGIYRHVWLDVTDPVYIVPWGIYIATPKISADSAEIQVRTRVFNNTMGIQQVTIKQEVIDPGGKVVGAVEGKQLFNRQVAPVGADQEIPQTITIAAPQLWSPEKPAMYALRTTVSAGDAFVDQVQTPFGIRSLDYDVNKGFLLNGQHIKMLGMCLHQDGGAMGAAIPIDVWERRLTALKQMGCNAIRCSHNPPAPEFLDLCDRLGFLVMDEAFDEWSVTKGQLKGSYSTLFNDNSKNDLTAMLRRDRNHPSIVMWSIGNEIPQQSNQRGVDIAQSLAAICHTEDPTRPVTSACDNVHAPNPTWPAFLDALDIAGYNYVDRWGDHREIFFSDDREKYPERKFVGTEDVCIGGVRGSYFGGAGGAPGAGRGGRGGAGAATPFPYASSMIRAEQLWKFNATHDYVIGYFMWTGIDYLGEAGAWPRKGASSGVLDTCGFPKDGYYFYQSQWTTAPMVHVFPHWNYSGEKDAIIPVVVYSNCPQVELQLNGKSFGTKSLIFPRPGATRSWSDPTPAGTTADLHLTWDVPYEPGTLRVIGKRAGQVIAQEEIKTAGAPASIALQLDKTTLDSAAPGVAQVEMRILDADGTLVPTADNSISLSIQGPAKLIGFDNGDQSSHDSYQAAMRPAFNGMALAILQASPSAGHVKVTAQAEGLKEATVEFNVTAGTPVPALP